MFSLPKLLHKKKEKRKFFLTLVFKQYQLHAFLAEEVNYKFTIIHSSERKLENHINEISFEELAQIGDSLVSPMEQYVSSPSDIDKTVFALPHDWIEDNKVKKERLDILKKFCESLSLTPIGFVVNSEAIVHKLHAIEGVPLSGIIIDVNKKSFLLYVVKNNEIITSLEASLDGGLIHAVEKSLKETELEVLPNRIILLESEETEQIKNDLLSHTWPSNLPFLQIPTVSVFKKGLEQEAIIEGVSGRLKLEVDYKSEEKIIKSKPEKPSVILSDMHEFGFEREGEHIKEMEEGVSEESNIMPVEGFAKDETEIFQSKPDVTHLKHKKKMILSFPQHLKIPNIESVFMFAKELRYRPGIIMIPLVLMLILIGGSYAYLRFFSTVKIVVFTDAEKVSIDTDIVLSSENDPSIDVPILPLGTIPQKVDGEASVETTGEKETGEKAKGEVTVFNKTEKSIDFKKGDVIISEKKLEFVLTGDVSVASTSAFSTEFSSAKVSVEASEFGKEYNFPKDTNFTFEGRPSSSYFAKNDEAFSGGTKNVSQVVSKEDIDLLEEEIAKTVESKARQQAQNEIDENQILLEDVLSSDLSNLTFSKKAGEEAKEVSVTGEVVFEFGVYNNSDVEKLARGLSEKEIPKSFTFNREQSQISLENLKNNDSRISARLIAEAVYTPTIETKKIQDEFKGKTVASVRKNLKSIEGVRDVTIVPGISIPLISNIMPLNAQKITVEVKSEL